MIEEYSALRRNCPKLRSTVSEPFALRRYIWPRPVRANVWPRQPVKGLDRGAWLLGSGALSWISSRPGIKHAVVGRWRGRGAQAGSSAQVRQASLFLAPNFLSPRLDSTKPAACPPLLPQRTQHLSLSPQFLIPIPPTLLLCKILTSVSVSATCPTPVISPLASAHL